MKMFISKKAKIKASFEGDAIILGPAILEENTLIGFNVLIGYPSKDKIIKIMNTKKVGINELDEISNGSKISKNCIIRSNSIIYENVEIHENVEIGHNVLIRSNSKIKENSKIGSYTILDGCVKIGANTNIQSAVYLPHSSIVGNNVFIAPCVCVTNDKYPPSGKLKGVIISKNSIIGANSILIAGIKIGENSVIAAGSIVTKDIPSNIVVAGIPARKIMDRKKYEEKMEEWRKT